MTCNKKESGITGVVKEHGTGKRLPNIQVDLHEDHTWYFLKSGKMGSDKLVATTFTDNSGYFNFDRKRKGNQYFEVNPASTDYWHYTVPAISEEIFLIPIGTIKFHIKNSLSSLLSPMDNLSFQIGYPSFFYIDFPGNYQDFTFYAKCGGNSYSNKIYWMTVNNQVFSNMHDTNVVCPGRDTVSVTLSF
jgi:hypothetical protein